MPATSSLVTGSSIAEAALPLSKARRIFDMGAHLMSLLHKRSEDTLDYFLDLLDWLEPGESVIACDAFTSTEQTGVLMVDRLRFADTGVVVWLKGGGNGSRYTVYVTVRTSLSKVKLFAFVVLTRGVVDAPGEDTPDLGLSTSALGFGEVLVGEDGIEALTVTNNGGAGLIITGVTVTGEFTLTGGSPPATLAPGASFLLTFTFTPTSIGAKTGTASIASNAAGSPAVVSLYGTGMVEAVPENALLTSGGGPLLTWDDLPVLVSEGDDPDPPPVPAGALLAEGDGTPLLTEDDLMLEV